MDIKSLGTDILLISNYILVTHFLYCVKFIYFEDYQQVISNKCIIVTMCCLHHDILSLESHSLLNMDRNIPFINDIFSNLDRFPDLIRRS